MLPVFRMKKLCLTLAPCLVAVACGQQRAGADPQVRQRSAMVATQIEERGVAAEKVLAAMRKVPRHLFVPQELQRRAYHDSALPIGHGQTISHPFIVAFMTAALDLKGHEKVLEIGT